MTTGTKIVLAVIGLVVGIMIAYYGFLMPGSSSEAPVIQDPVAAHDSAPADTPDDTPGRPTTSGPTPMEPAGPTTVTMGQPPRSGSSLGTDNASMGPYAGGPAWSPTTAPPAETAPAPLTPRPDRAWSPLPASSLSDGGKSTPLEVTPRSAPDAGPDAAADTGPATLRANQPARVPAAPAAPRYSSYTIRSGDTMSSIAGSWFGDPNKWDLIAKANPLVDPSRLQIGQVLRLPAKDAKREPASVSNDRAGATTYAVRSGDTLSSIAEAHYGAAKYWREIHEANRKVIGANADDLRVGMRLTIPALRPAGDRP